MQNPRRNLTLPDRPAKLHPVPELGPETTRSSYIVAPDVASIVVEAGRQLGAPIKKGARSQAAFDRALARLIRLASAEVDLRLYESANRLKQ